ncbi:MAG: type IV secretion system DNA-binding domain-containing protein [Parcubacteria group bacterium]|nr:type IV secretion system DNA-binding domain-containing protein [Parcubacteria group bacterium]
MILVLAILFVLFVAGFFILVRILYSRKLFGEAIQYLLAEVRLPKPDAEKAKEFKVEIGTFEQLVSALAKFKYPVVFEISVKHVGEEIHFFVAAHRKEFEAVLRQVQAFWPKANVARSEDYNIFNPEGEAVASRALLSKHFALPLRTYDLFESDPFSSITNSLAKLAHEGEGVAIQFVIGKAGKERKIVEKAEKKLREGKSLKEVLGGASEALGQAFEEAMKPKSKEETEKKRFVSPPQDTEALKILERKLRKPLLRANLRIVASAADRVRAESILSEAKSAFLQFEDPGANGLRWVDLRGRAKERAIFDFSFRNYRSEESFILTTEELASLVHLPTAVVETPRLRWAKSAESQPPTNLPDTGIMVGESVFRGERRPVRITEDDRRRHVYAVGQTGTGKSVFLREMARQDMEAGAGMCFIDPHGDTVESLLGLVPQDRVEDVIYFNPPDIERPMGLNMFEYDPAKPEQRTFIANEMIEIFHKLWEKIPEAFGPMFEQYMRNSMLLVMGDPVLKATIMDVPRVLADAVFRHELLARCANPPVIEFWTKEAEKAGGEAALANMVPYITSKLNPFIANDVMRPIVGQVVSAFRPRDVMDKKKILLVNLAKGVLGETNSFLLGMIIVGKMFMAALSRADIPEEDRKDFYMYLDEFQNVTTSTLAGVLSEARKYRFSLVMAHQFIAQLREDVRDAVFGNVGTLISFRVGPQDAEFLVKQFAPVFTAQDLVNIDNYNAYMKPLIKGQTARAFNIMTFPPAKGNAERAVKVKDYSRIRYGRPREEVDQEIFARYRTT